MLCNKNNLFSVCWDYLHTVACREKKKCVYIYIYIYIYIYLFFFFEFLEFELSFFPKSKNTRFQMINERNRCLKSKSSIWTALSLSHPSREIPTSKATNAKRKACHLPIQCKTSGWSAGTEGVVLLSSPPHELQTAHLTSLLPQSELEPELICVCPLSKRN